MMKSSAARHGVLVLSQSTRTVHKQFLGAAPGAAQSSTRPATGLVTQKCSAGRSDKTYRHPVVTQSNVPDHIRWLQVPNRLPVLHHGRVVLALGVLRVTPPAVQAVHGQAVHMPAVQIEAVHAHDEVWFQEQCMCGTRRGGSACWQDS